MEKTRIILSSIILIVAAALITLWAVGVFPSGDFPAKTESTAETPTLHYWADGESRSAFLAYVADVTDPENPDFIPETDRLAVFDLDGTLCCEQCPTYLEWMMYVSRVLDDPDYTPTEEQVALAGEIITAVRTGIASADLEARQYQMNEEVFAGMPVSEYRAYVAKFLQTSADRFENLLLKDSWYRTTVEAAQYLQKNGFIVYICSGTDRDTDRVMIADVIGIPYRQVIGSDCYTIGSYQGELPYLEYQYSAEDFPVRTADGIIKNVKSSKPMQIMHELGQKPVIAFGNSTGDASMFMFTTNDNPYRSIAFCVIPDDGERETAFPDKTESLTQMCSANGWHTVSMKNDFVTIYGDDVISVKNFTPWLDRMEELYEAAALPEAA